MRRTVANTAELRPFSVLREIGLSASHMQRLEHYRTKHERLNRVVGVLKWPDGTWCALAIHSEKFSAVIVDEGQQTAAYEDARSMIDGDFLPLLSLRWETHA
ncbi:hypothetical protein [Pseudomonas sp. WC2]|uniref:hypothetical protein n=1 Tax=Pseudomonas sp. WC2 TaxID=3424773 RepID=UPI003D32923F